MSTSRNLLTGVAAALLVVLSGCSGSEKNRPDVIAEPGIPVTEDTVTSTDGASHTALEELPISSEELREVEDRLSSGNEEEVASVIGLTDPSVVDEVAFLELVDLLQTVELDPAGLTRVADGVVSIPATTNDGQWLVYLVQHDDGDWRVSVTEELP